MKDTNKNNIKIPGSKGQKFDASLLAGELLTLGPDIRETKAFDSDII